MIGIIDYGMGNLRSVQKAFERVGGNAMLVSTEAGLASAEKIVLPGVAAFGDAMEQLRIQRLVDPLLKAIENGTPYLGFCLGLQLLFDVSYEDGRHAGLGILPDKIVRFEFPTNVTCERLAVPHMGWNSIRLLKQCAMLKGVESDSYAYFAHSYHVVPADEAIVATTTEYGYQFVSSVWQRNIFATQFHPEKSQAVGLKLLENFVNL
ncbi:MAG: imidazole glycerol phosphate synthase subunit HisH [Planctomycetota bacterium]|jgi:glutamine amidotransferase